MPHLYNAVNNLGGPHAITCQFDFVAVTGQDEATGSGSKTKGRSSKLAKKFVGCILLQHCHFVQMVLVIYEHVHENIL